MGNSKKLERTESCFTEPIKKMSLRKSWGNSPKNWKSVRFKHEGQHEAQQSRGEGVFGVGVKKNDGQTKKCSGQKGKWGIGNKK